LFLRNLRNLRFAVRRHGAVENSATLTASNRRLRRFGGSTAAKSFLCQSLPGEHLRLRIGAICGSQLPAVAASLGEGKGGQNARKSLNLEIGEAKLDQYRILDLP
jgi:hypothetical protein